MSLFGFGDIKFNQVLGPNGPLKALEGTEFAGTALRYPQDVGNYDKGHYMVFYIREQKNSSYAQNANISDSAIGSDQSGTQFNATGLPISAGTDYASVLQNKINSGLSTLNSATGGVLSGVTGAIGSATSSVTNLFGQKSVGILGDSGSTRSVIDYEVKKITNKSNIQTTQLTKDCIALYMPDTLMYSQQQNYADISPGNQAIGQAANAGISALDQYKAAGNKITEEMKNSLAKTAGLTGLNAAANQLGDTGRALFRGLTGVAINPLLELIYTAPAFRTFQFDFTFYPRGEKEAFDVQKIIEMFKFHQSPEFVPGTFKGFLIPPSEFDIRFYYGGAQNPNIDPISTCVLTSIDINYAPNGFSAYEVPGETRPSLGGTGMPVAIQMSLQFREVTYVTKEDFNKTYSSYTKSSQAGEYGTS
jgi:hypothetical protein